MKLINSPNKSSPIMYHITVPWRVLISYKMPGGHSCIVLVACFCIKSGAFWAQGAESRDLRLGVLFGGKGILKVYFSPILSINGGGGSRM